MTLQMRMIPITPKKPFGNIPKMFSLLHNGVRDQSAEGVRFMSQYPSKRGGSTYRRTGTLRRSWSFRVTSGGGLIQGNILSSSNTAPYNEEVQGADQGEIFSVLGWRNINDLGKIIDRDFPKRMQDMVQRVF